MIEKTKWPRDLALAVAAEITNRISPACLRLAVAGSLRRGKLEVGDIEIVFVPVMTERPDGLFESRIVSVTDEIIEQLLNDGYFQKRPNKTGGFTWGEKNKLAIHTASGIPVDLFAEYDSDEWWRSLVIRTGSKEFNVLLMSTAPKVGVLAHAYNIGLTNLEGERILVDSERAFIERCGVKYREPCDR